MPVTITGLEQLYKKLDNAAATQTLVPPMQRSVLRLQRPMQKYPPAPAQSKYRRTGTYGRRFTTAVTVSGNGVVGRVGNNVPYAPFVGSGILQTRAHAATGWETDTADVTENADVILADFQAAVDRALAG
jgi:hypothetical protein